MAINPIKVLLFLLGGTVAAGGIAYMAGVFDPSAPPVNLAGGTDPAAKGDRTVASAPPADTVPEKPAAEPMTPPAAELPADAANAKDPAAATPPPAIGAADTSATPLAKDAAPPAEAAMTPPPATETPPSVADAPPAMAASPDDTTKPPEVAALEPPAMKSDPAAVETTPPAEKPPAVETAPAKPGIQPPSFDLMRVEADGSIVIAGHAAANSKVEAVIGSRVIGSATAGPEGDFAIVLDDPLKPGDYQIVLRATGPDGVVAMSLETAVVSIPETADGQVLALVQAPGKPAELITVPKTEAPPATAAADPAPADAAKAPEKVAAYDAAAVDKPADPNKPADVAIAPAPAEAPPKSPPQSGSTTAKITVEAVEIEGRRIFIAGMAEAGIRVRAYANDILLGEAVTSQAKRFLVEAERDLPVGDYIIRVDALAADGVKVIARAAVPFQREPGENLAAVAPPAAADASKAEQPADQNVAAADSAPDPAKSDKPAAVGNGTGAADATAPAEEPVTPPPSSDSAAPGTGGAEAKQPAADVAAAAATDGANPEPPAVKSAPSAPAAENPVAVSPPAVDSGVSTAPPAEVPPKDLAATPEPGPAVTSPPASAAEPPSSSAPPADIAAAEPPSDGGVAAAPGEVLSPKLQPVDGSVIIRRGDSLWRISRRVYGRGVRYSTIYLANQPQIRDPNLIYPGQVFGVPTKTDQGEAADMKGLGDQAVDANQAAPATTQQ